MRSHSPFLAISPLGILAMSLGAALPGDADAMDCNKASTPTERTICGDKKLLLLDRDLTVVYKKFIKTFSDTGHYTRLVAETKADQWTWLQKRDACGADAACIKAAYAERLEILQREVCYAPDPGTAPTAPACSPADRVNYGFIGEHEGSMFDFYVPGAFKVNLDLGRNLGERYNKKHEQKAIGGSGITVGEGVDLRHQTEDKLRKYMKDEEKRIGQLPNGVSIDAILSKVKPYLGKKENEAVEALNNYHKMYGKYPELEPQEMVFLSSAVQRAYFADGADRLFNKYSEIDLRKLPEAVQTTFTDMVYHSFIPEVAKLYRKGEWEAAAEKFRELADTDKYRAFKDRFLDRAQVLSDAIRAGTLPKQGDPCAPKKTPVAFNRSLWWETQRRSRWA